MAATSQVCSSLSSDAARASCVSLMTQSCACAVGIDATQGVDVALRQFNYTFVQLFNEELSQRLGCNFTMQPLTSTRCVLALIIVFVLHQLSSSSAG